MDKTLRTTPSGHHGPRVRVTPSESPHGQAHRPHNPDCRSGFASPYRRRTGGAGIRGYVLKTIRQTVGLTQDQEQLAEKVQVDVSTLQGWESGRCPLMAIPAGSYLRLRHLLHRLGASPRLLVQLDTALEADRFIGYMLASDGPIDLDNHPLATWVITRPFTELVAWPFTGTVPSELKEAAPLQRRGLSAAGPVLAADERRHMVDHLQAAAEQAEKDSVEGALLRRQAHYVAGFDKSSQTVEWLAVMQRAEQRRLGSKVDVDTGVGGSPVGGAFDGAHR